ncbi:MAG: type II toxin-antitoxin system VapC family toxin [Gaiellaceae bacterium]
MIYLDSSALVKLVVEEPESEALRGFVASWNGRLLSSAISVVEVMRAAARCAAEERAAALLETLQQLEIEPAILETAGRVQPQTLSSLDALHLASALSVREPLERFVCYDARLLAAARDAGLATTSPA